jgi:hypothetical protein
MIVQIADRDEAFQETRKTAQPKEDIVRYRTVGKQPRCVCPPLQG